MTTYVVVRAVSSAGDAAFAVALAWTAVQLLSPAGAGLAIGCATIPQAVTTLYGGHIADRLDTRRLVIGGEVSRGAVLALASVAWIAPEARHTVIFTVPAVFGAISGMANPALAAMPRQLVEPGQLVSLAGFSQTASRLARLLGAPLGGYLVATAGLVPVMAVDLLTFLISSAAIAVAVRLCFPIDHSRARRESLFRSLAESAKYLGRDRRALVFVTVISSTNVFVGPAVSVGFALRVHQSGWSASWVGAAEAVFAVGAVCAGLVAARWTGDYLPRRAFIALSLQGLGIGLTGVGMVPVFATGALAIGLTAGAASVWLSGTFQRVVDERYLGRVSSLTQLGDLLLLPAATPLFGALAEDSSLTACLAYGTAMFCACLLGASSRVVRDLK